MKPIVKISVLSGCIFGAVAGLAVALSMDFMMGGPAGGSWHDAVKNDVNTLLGLNWAAREWFINLATTAVILLVGIIGAVMGAVCGFIAGKVFSVLTK